MVIFTAVIWCLILAIKRTRRLYELRAQQAIVLAAFFMVMADAIALMRHVDIWETRISPPHMFFLLGVIVAASVVTQWSILKAQTLQLHSSWKQILLLVISAAAVLTVCPEWTFNYSGTLAHALTVAVGAAVLFLPMRRLLLLLVPESSQTPSSGSTIQWVPLVAGICLTGLGIYSTRFPNAPHYAPFTVPIAGFLVAYGVIAEPLGMTQAKR